jgi:alginate O-acetyltransferase complex protein AlgI
VGLKPDRTYNYFKSPRVKNPLLFNSSKFLLTFLPLTFAIYFLLNRFRLARAGKVWLAFASLVFYASWDSKYLPLLLASMMFNYWAGSNLSASFEKIPSIGRFKPKRGYVLGVSIAVNIALLAYYKYANFFVDNVNALLGTQYLFKTVILPLGISFFTFTQIAYLVDSYKGQVKEYSFVNYVLFVTFFPHLIAGPILHHREMMSQFESKWTLTIRYRHILQGLFIFGLGLFKKVVLADTFALWATPGFDNPLPLDFVSAWTTSLAYTFQLYFDFSGYCDMAIGAALLFNIWLPINFNSPYKALDIQDFWRRWHMTLSRFLRDYLYIPLGGNRGSALNMYLNLFVTFVLGGLWHGASWMFIIWGALHGAALVIHRLWSSSGYRLPKRWAWLITFMFVNVTWVFFRAKSLDDAQRILSGMVDFSSILSLSMSSLPTANLAWSGPLGDRLLTSLPPGIAANVLPLIFIVIALFVCAQKNSLELMTKVEQSPRRLALGLALFVVAWYGTFTTTSSVFLYFNF